MTHNLKGHSKSTEDAECDLRHGRGEPLLSRGFVLGLPHPFFLGTNNKKKLKTNKSLGPSRSAKLRETLGGFEVDRGRNKDRRRLHMDIGEASIKGSLCLT